MKIKLTTDSACDLPAELLEQFGVSGVIPLIVIFGGEERKDGTFNPTEIYDFYKNTKTLPTTSAINPYEYEEFFEKQVADGQAVVHLSMSGEMSASCRNAKIAAQQFENVYVVDGRQVSTGTSMLLLCAHNILKGNSEISAEDLAVTITGMTNKVNTSYCIDTITYLYKNGRCSALGLLGANLLDLHPCIKVTNGANEVGRKYRGKMQTVITRYIEDVRKDNPDYDDSYCFITYSPGTDSKIIDTALTLTEKLFGFKETFVTETGATMTCHCGKGTIGLVFMSK